MSSEITINEKGQSEMMYVGTRPWHGLGQKLDKPATAAEAITAANLTWDVEKKELYFPTADGVKLIKNKFANVRNDNEKVLGIVGERYIPVQNVEAFAFFDAVIGTGGAYYETAGSLFGGKKIFLVAKLPEVLRATADDVIEQYLVLVNGHDGHVPIMGFSSGIRVVCQNTLSSALRSAKNKFSIRHVGNMGDKIKLAQDTIGFSRRYFAEYQTIIDRLREKIVTTKEVEKLIEASLQITEKDKIKDDAGNDGVSLQKKKATEKILINFTDDYKNNMQGIKGTAWSIYNAVAQYTDHESKAATKGADSRFNTIMFGTAAEVKQRALNTALNLV